MVIYCQTIYNVQLKENNLEWMMITIDWCNKVL